MKAKAATPRRPRRKPGPPKSITFREVQRRAEAGVSLDDILHVLDIDPRLASRHREKLEATVAKGHAIYRAAIAKRLQKEGVLRGRAHSLLALARNFLGYDKPRPDTGYDWQFVHRTAAEAMETLERLLAARRAAHPQEGSVATCTIHGVAFACPACVAEPAVAPCCEAHSIPARLAGQAGPTEPLLEALAPAEVEGGRHD